jgi:D-amino-acid oxidase
MTSRRALLQASAALGTSLLLPACLHTPRRGAALQLAPAQVAPHRVIREVAGPRPFRPAGFRVAHENLGDKQLIHNYGHGGCGVTLSWGTARLALDHALALPHRRAAVIGCGAVGLATARLFQDHGFSVTIYADALPPETVSNIAGALFAPSYLLDREHQNDAFGAELARAVRFAHRRFQLLPDQRYGVRWIPLYMLSHRTEMPLGWDWAQTPELFVPLAHAPGTHPFGDRYAHEFRMMVIEPSIYLPAMIDSFRQAGGSIVLRHLHDTADVMRLPETLVVNCAGLGAGELFGDPDLIPIKGQLTVLDPQPEVNYGVIEGGTGLYMFPRRDGLQLGGVARRGDASTDIDPDQSARILTGHQRLFSF